MRNKIVTLNWHNYKYLAYEKNFAKREIISLLSPDVINETDDQVEITGNFNKKSLNRLVYFKDYQLDGITESTIQYKLECSCIINGHHKRQSTRYSVHGLHEYKGKFNPQIVRGVLNILGVSEKAKILDPFVGSGTTLVECAHVKINAIGWDINPLAVYITNAKLLALSTPAKDLLSTFENITKVFNNRTKKIYAPIPSDNVRAEYLWNWFDKQHLLEIERLRLIILEYAKTHSEIFLSLSSDLLREYSLQEPTDLRIRRRFSPYPNISFFEAYQKKVINFISNLINVQNVLGILNYYNHAYLFDSRTTRKTKPNYIKGNFDAALTSPPYATALPYIDTQRLSLVWLGLLSPNEISELEANLTGSREFVLEQKKKWGQSLLDNSQNLPKEVHHYCMNLHQSLSKEDGFRRKSVPILLYRYLSDMRESFQTVINVMSKSAPYALIIGNNSTVLGGKKFDIDTPQLLRMIAEQAGWKHKESILLQTYQRYGLHSANAVKAETLLILEKP